ncbi:hypothetical protein SAMN04488543_2813 [Friedmanniella luteola]|uniref:TrbL/VirB6 plasmid conjugal transfer protein n=1 Tax=Friedmanniella luteola TaxID=546871 RepID=A0A1H1WS52_9ACTN|nr:hypothetical protein [Friedmanniella luteola]SDS99914.1 hypothetical protein SAMN04488543_2813 [Friedmanniella luteola]
MVPEVPSPFEWLADSAGKVAADAWTTAMLGLWNAGLWVLRLALRFVDGLLTPDLSPDGPGAAIYATTFWLAGVLVLVMLMVQLGVTALRRDGKSLATALIGSAKFVVVWAGWLVYGAAVVAACGGISRALMRNLLRVDSWAAWQPFTELDVAHVTEATVATVLGLLGLLLWLAAIGHLLVMITRAGALIVLAAMTPAMAAGLVADAGRTWFWKSLRWFHAAAFTPVLMVLMLGVGVQMTNGVAYGRADSVERAVGTALPGVLLIVVACFAPLALFKLLAFVDPTTSSGAALRAGLASADGVGGFLSGRSGSSAGDGVAAAAGGGDGRSSGEAASGEATDARFSQAASTLALGAGGGAAGLAAAGLDAARQTAASATAVGSDLTNQMSVGHHSYHPNNPDVSSEYDRPEADDGTDGGLGQDEPGSAPDHRDSPAAGGGPRSEGSPAGRGGSGPGGGGSASPPRRPPGPAAGGTGAGAAEGAAGAAASVPIVPV